MQRLGSESENAVNGVADGARPGSAPRRSCAPRSNRRSRFGPLAYARACTHTHTHAPACAAAEERKPVAKPVFVPRVVTFGGRGHRNFPKELYRADAQAQRGVGAKGVASGNGRGRGRGRMQADEAIEPGFNV